MELAIANERSSYHRLSLGLTWRYLEPLVLIAVYYMFLVVLRGNVPDETPILFVIFSGLMIFDWFNRIINTASGALLQYESIIVTTPAPILVFILSNFMFASYGSLPLWILSLIFFIWQGVGPDVHWIAIPFIIGMMATMMFPIAVFLALLGVFVRDISRFILLTARMLLFVSPVLYEFDRVEGTLRTLLSLNPLTTFIEALRDSLYRGAFPSSANLLWFFGLSILLFFLAIHLVVKVGRKVVKDI